MGRGGWGGGAGSCLALSVCFYLGQNCSRGEGISSSMRVSLSIYTFYMNDINIYVHKEILRGFEK